MDNEFDILRDAGQRASDETKKEIEIMLLLRSKLLKQVIKDSKSPRGTLQYSDTSGNDNESVPWSTFILWDEVFQD